MMKTFHPFSPVNKLNSLLFHEYYSTTFTSETKGRENEEKERKTIKTPSQCIFHLQQSELYTRNVNKMNILYILKKDFI